MECGGVGARAAACYRRAMWRVAEPEEDERIVAMCLALNTEDPGEPVRREQVLATLATLRAEPVRGRALVAEAGGRIVGYALLISFWSNEYGGEICAVDELYITPEHRARGIGSALFEKVAEDRRIWPRRPVAIELEVAPDNARARALYERLGLRARNMTLRRRVDPAAE
jgi:GNAT superfamily N-acetyltransferase